jgi:hypothetical protein
MNEHSTKAMSERIMVCSGSLFEPIIGFSRAVRVATSLPSAAPPRARVARW